MRFFTALSTVILGILSVQAADWALVDISTAHMRAQPAHASEMVSQATMGTPVKIVEPGEGWLLVETPEGYQGYINASSLSRKTEEDMAQWAASPRLVVTALDPVYVTARPGSTSPRERVSDLVNGVILENLGQAPDGYYNVRLPDGRTGYVSAADVDLFDRWAQKPFDVEALLDYAYAMEGAPYVWGGTSNKGLDCSGLSKTAYFTQGIILRRDASQQAKTGERLDPSDWRSYQPGDLLYFGNPETQRVTHVAIYDRDGHFVHSSGRVKRNSLDPTHPDYLDGYNFLWATRMIDSVGTDGITRVGEHPWYTQPNFYKTK